MEHKALYSFPAWDLVRHRERFNRLLASHPYFCLYTARDHFRSIAAAWTTDFVFSFLPVMIPTSFSEHLFLGLEVVSCRHGHFFPVHGCTICSQQSYEKFYENDHLTERGRPLCPGLILIIFNTLTIFMPSVNCVRMNYICSPSTE